MKDEVIIIVLAFAMVIVIFTFGYMPQAQGTQTIGIEMTK